MFHIPGNASAKLVINRSEVSIYSLIRGEGCGYERSVQAGTTTHKRALTRIAQLRSSTESATKNLEASRELAHEEHATHRACRGPELAS